MSEHDERDNPTSEATRFPNSRKLRISIGGMRAEATHSHADVVGFLRQVVQAVEDVNPPDDLRGAVFTVAQGMLATYHQIGGVQVPVVQYPGVN